MKRVIYVVNQFPSLTETFIAREVQALQDSGFDTRIFALRRSKESVLSKDVTRVASRVRFPSRLPGLTGLPTNLGQIPGGFKAYGALLVGQLMPSFFAPRRFLRRTLMLHRAMALAKLIWEEGDAHIHAQFAHVNAAVARWACSLTGSSFSVATHAWDIFAQPAREVLAYLEGASFVTCCTQQGMERLRQVLPQERHGDLLRVRHGLPPETLSMPTGGGGQLILGVGRLVRKKGFCNLIDACHILAHRGIHLKCLIVGDGPLEGPLRQMISALGLDDNVRLLGAMPHERIVELLADEAALFVLPSVVTPNGDRDGLPNVILEAMAAALPVITTTASAAGEVIVDGTNGVLVEPEDPETLAARIEALLGDRATRLRLGQAARKTVKTAFSSSRCVAPLVEKLRTAPHCNTGT